MNARRFRSALLVFLALGLAAPSIADEVVLVSGDRLVGRILDKSGNELVIDTNDAGIVRVQVDRVQAITTDAPLDVMLA